ncbi:cellulose-binding domain-containing protein [Myceligenerans cantabricum]
MRTGIRERRRRLLGVSAAVASVLAAGVVLTSTTGTAQAAACDSAGYTVVNSWDGGHQAAVSITAGSEAIDGWTLEFELPEGTAVSSAWNADVSQSGTTVTASDLGWNAVVPAGSTIDAFGAVVSAGAGFEAPTVFRVDGVLCGDDGDPEPTPDPSDPSPTCPARTLDDDCGEPTPTPTADPAECASGATCDGFEDQTAPEPGGDWTVGAENCTGDGTATVDTGVAHSGTTSIRVDGGAGYCNHVFLGRDLPDDAEWFRVFLRHTTEQPQTHTTMIALNDAADNGSDLRVGGQNGALQWNRESDDATLPEQSPAGVALSWPLPVDTWTCLEFQVAGGNLSTWVDGEPVEGLVVDGEPTPDVDSQWLRRADWNPSLTDLRLGWESYGADADTLWYDDVAFGQERIGC